MEIVEKTKNLHPQIHRQPLGIKNPPAVEHITDQPDILTLPGNDNIISEFSITGDKANNAFDNLRQQNSPSPAEKDVPFSKDRAAVYMTGRTPSNSSITLEVLPTPKGGAALGTFGGAR